MTTPTYRHARVSDIPALMSIRNNVRENPLVSLVLSHEDYVQAMTVDGRAWLCEVGGAVVGFSCGRVAQGDIWALFVREDHEGRGIGSALLRLVEHWMFDAGLQEIWLVTAPKTRAEGLYRARGWARRGTTASGEAKYVLKRSARSPEG